MYILQQAEAENIAERFDYLEAKLDEFGKKDWLNLALGVFTSIALGLAFSEGALARLH